MRRAPESKIFIGNLSFTTTKAALADLLVANGVKPLHIVMVSDRETGNFRGFAFATLFGDAEVGAACAALDGIEWDGRRLTVNRAKEKVR